MSSAASRPGRRPVDRPGSDVASKPRRIAREDDPEATAPTWADVIAASAAQTPAPRERSPRAVPRPAAPEARAAAPAARRPRAIAAKAPAARAPREAREPAPEVTPGDRIDHPRLGRCTVYRVERETRRLQVALANGRLTRLSLDILELTPIGVEGGQRVFQAAVR